MFPSVIKSDLHACILHVFATILGTPQCQDSLVPQSLPIFRRFVAGLARRPQQETPTQLRSALARFLAILKGAQKLDSDAALPCEKNTLLACTILLTSAARILPPADDIITRFVDELADCLNSRSTTKVAAGLSRSLLLPPLPPNTSTPPQPTSESQIISTLLPHLLTFLTDPSPAPGTEESRTQITQSLLAFTLSLPAARRSPALALVVPAMLKRVSNEGKQAWPETSAALTDLAGKDPDAFRGVIGQMSAGQRAFVEEVIRAGGGAGGGVGAKGRGAKEGGEGDDAVEKQPSIALKMNF